MASVACGNCGEPLDEPMNLDPARRQPCPKCASLSRKMFVGLSGEMPPPPSSLKAKGRHAGTGWNKWFIKTFTGADWSQALQRFVRKVRILDRDNDRYVEKVIDPATGDVLRDVEEPLSEHQGHGSAKFRDPTVGSED
ncbi:MAG: hypothetical protein AB7F99_20440 [Vicinamibacterales bacterium]